MAHRKKTKHSKRRVAAPLPPRPTAPEKAAGEAMPTALRTTPRVTQLKGPDLATEFRYVRSDLLRLAIVAGAIFLAFGALYFVVR